MIIQFTPIADNDKVLTEEDLKSIGDDILYTLHMADFLHMPDMDFKEISEMDPEIKSLLN